MAGRLPKVTEYIKNLGRSVGYATIDIIKEPTENISDFMETNEDLFKVVYSATKNYKQTLRTVDRSIKRSKIYEAANAGFAALKDDLRTGKFYNKEREDRYGLESFGDDFADFSEFEDDNFDFSSVQSDEEIGGKQEPPALIKAMGTSTSSLGNAIITASRDQSNVTVAATEAIINTNKASVRLLSAQNEKINAAIVTGFAGVNAGINLISTIMSGPLSNFMNESTKFYTDISSKIGETNAYLKELTEMQRNLYKQEREWKPSAYDEVTSASGMPNITAYAKRVYKNILDLDPTGGLLMGDKDENLLKAFVGSPLKAIPTMIAKMIIPATVSKTLQAFDENMSGLFSAFIARMNSWATNSSSGGIDLKGIIGRILGVNISRKTSVDTSRYNRGPIPFDGETKKAIVDVIPAYLARIESAISGMPERIYDGRSGTFKTVRQVHKEYRDIEDRGAMEALSSIQESFDRWARERARNYQVGGREATDKQKTAYYRDLEKKFKKVGRRIYKDGGDFQPFAGFGPKGERRLEDKLYSGGIGQFDDDEWLSLMRYLNANNKKGIYNISRNTIAAIQRANRELQDAEGAFANPYTALFDGRLNILDKHGRVKGFRADDSEYKGLYKKNDRFKSATDYLKDILAEVRWIRMKGVRTTGRGGGGRANRANFQVGPNGPMDTSKMTFEQYYEANFADDTFEDEYLNQTDIAWQKASKQEQSELEKYGVTKENLKELRAAQTIGEKWKAAKRSVDKLLKSPAEWATKVISKADQRIFDAMFGTPEGESFRDKHGLEYRGFLEYLVARAGEVFDDFKDKMKATWQKFSEWFKNTKAGKWLTEKGGQFARDTKDALKRKFGYAKSAVRESWDNTYGRIAESIRQGRLVDASFVQTMRRQRELGLDVHDAGDETTRITDNYDDYTDLLQSLNQGDIANSAFGRVATKYGLTMLSPGEIVIPNAGYGRQLRNLAGEKREKSRIIRALKGGNISHNAQGTQRSQGGSDANNMMAAVKKVMGEIGGKGGDIAADAIIGSGVSLITGIFGGPLLGAAAGAGIGLIKNSETVQKALFGEVGDDGKRKGGVIPKSVIDKVTAFKDKNGKSMLNFGIAGGIAGLFTPLGLVGGILAGSALGYVKNTTWFQEMMFGNEATGKQGLMSKETKEKLKKAFPSMAIGAGAGILLGPFGLVGNALLGAGAGYLSTSEKFKELLLGKEGDDGKKHGGLAGAIKDGLVTPLSNIGKKIAADIQGYAKKNIIDPMKEFIEGSGQFIRNIFLSVGDRVADGINGIFEKHVGLPFEEWIREKVFKRASSVIGAVLKPVTGAAKAVVSAPFRALGQVGVTLKSGQIARGTMDTMTAQQRLDYRQKHRARFARLGLTGRDKTRQLDEMLAGADEATLESMSANINTFIQNRGKHNVAYNNLMDQTGSAVSDLFDANGIWASRGHAPIVNAANDKKAIMKALYKGDFNKVRSILKKLKLSDDEINEFMSSIDTNAIATARANMIQESGLDADAIDKLEEATGYTNLHKAGNRYVKQLGRLTSTELKSRKAANAAKTPEEKQAEAQQETADTSKRMLNVLIQINNSLNGVGRVLDENGQPVSSGEAKEAQQDTENTEDTETTSNNEEVPDGDDKASVDARNKAKKKGKLQQVIASGISSISNKLTGLFGGKKEEDETPSLISRLFNFMGNAGKSVLGLIGNFAGSKVGMVAAGVGAAALIGYGSEFVKDKLMPALEKSPLFQKISSAVGGFWDSVKSGQFFVDMAGKLSQGLTYALKNVAAPLTEAIITALPGVVTGIVSGLFAGIKNLFFGGGKDTKTTDFSNGSGSSDLTAGLKKATSSIPTGNDEAAIAANFSGGSSTYTVSSVTTPTYKDTVSKAAQEVISNSRASGGLTYSGSNNNSGAEAGVYENDDGSTTVVDGLGTATMYDASGKKLGSYDTSTGQITSGGGITTTQRGTVGHVATNAFVRGLATGKTPAIASTIGNIGRRLFSKKSITNSAKKVVTGGANPFSVIGRVGSAVSTSVKGALRVGTEATEAAAKAGSTIGRVATGASSALTGVDKIANAALNVGDKAATGVAKVGGKVADAADVVVSRFTNHTTSNSVANAIAKAADNAGGKVADGAISIAEKITSFGTKLVNSSFFSKICSFVSKFIKPIDQGVLKTTFEKLMKKIGENAAEKAGSKVASIALKAVGGLSPLAIITWGKAFYDGCWGKTETILGVTKDSGLDITPAMRFVTGLINALNENLLLGLIPIDWLMEQVISIFGGVLGVTSEEVKAAQEASDAILAQAGMDSGKTVTLEEYNNQTSLWTKLKNWVTGKDTTTYKDYEDDDKGKGKSNSISSLANSSVKDAKKSSKANADRIHKKIGKGRGGQQGGMYAAMRYGNSTIGEAGCAPVSAANMVGSSIPEAAAFAQRTGHVSADGSTDIGFFNDYFSAKGISNRTTTNRSDVANALDKGKSAILLGRDPGGGYESAYSNSSHYISARKGKNGSYIVNDPAIGIRKMPRSKVLKNMKASVITGRARSDNGAFGTTKAKSSKSFNPTATSGMTTDEKIQRIISVARDQVGYKEGSNNFSQYGQEYGLPNSAWCCMFVWWVFKHAGASDLFYGGNKCASCSQLMSYYSQNNQIVKNAKAGDIIFMNFKGGSSPGHVGICIEDSNGSTIKTIEGNTSPSSGSGSQDNGEGVYEKTRQMKYIVGIARPNYESATFDDVIPYGSVYSYSNGTVSTSTEETEDSLFSKIANAAKMVVKDAYGEGLYNAVFGDDTEDTSSATSSAIYNSPAFTGVGEVDSNVNDDGTLQGSSTAEKIWRYLRSKGYSKEGTAGIMGNLYRESGLQSNNLQNSYEKSLGYDDKSYTSAVNSGKYSAGKFQNDSAGYGLAQWTYHSRKKNLYDATVSKGRSIDSIKDQIDLLDKEVDSYGLSTALRSASSINNASDLFLDGFEKPAVRNYSDRRSSSQQIYNQFKGIGRGYAGRVNSKYTNEVGRARDDGTTRTVTSGTGTAAYTQFLQTIVSILLSIADNTEALSKILDILSKNFNINVSSEEVQQSSKDTKKRAKEALSQLMNNRSSAQDLSNILQTKDTSYLVDVMTSIARE